MQRVSLVSRTRLSVPLPSGRPLPRCRQTTAIPASRRDTTSALISGAALLNLLNVAPAPAAIPEPGTCQLEVALNGLQYCDLRQGTGPEPTKGQLIKCHYTGKLERNNVVFDSSYERGRPLTFTVGVGQVIKGWDIGIGGSVSDLIPAMKEGGKRRLVIPAALGYGDRGAGGIIQPGDTLLFDVELLPLNSGGGRR